MSHPNPAAQMKALLLNAEQRTATVQTIPLPTPNPNKAEALIKVHSIALNPVDSLYTAKPLGATGRVVGSDFAGTIVRSSHLLPGQRVAGFLQGACSRNDRPGAFAEYVVCPEDLLWLVSDDVTLEEAATNSLCGLTAAQAVFLRLGLEAPFAWREPESSSTLGHTAPIAATTKGPNPETNPLYILINGASTSVGLYAAQLIHYSRTATARPIHLIGLASPSNFTLLQRNPYSYISLLDYHSPTWPSAVLDLTKNRGIDLALDCISETSTVGDVSRTLHPQGRLAVLRSLAGGAWDSSHLAEGIVPSYGAVWEGLGERVEYQGFVLEASEEGRGFARAFYAWLSSSSAAGGGSGGEGRLVANPIRHMPGGLVRVVEDGFALLGGGRMGDRQGSRGEEWMRPVSGEKLVYRVGE